MSIISFIDIAIEAMPFSNELRAWCDIRPEFKDGLKFSNTDRFIPLGMVLTSRTVNVPADEVIGFYTYDYVSSKFKQDFIVNIGSENNEFVLYTSLPPANTGLYGKYVKHINEFFAIYGKKGDYAGTHHLDIEGIKALGNDDLTGRAQRAIQNGALMKVHGRRLYTQKELDDVMQKIKNAKIQSNLL